MALYSELLNRSGSGHPQHNYGYIISQATQPYLKALVN